MIQPRSQGLLRFQDGHLESGVDPGNEVASDPAVVWGKERGLISHELGFFMYARFKSEIQAYKP